MADMLGVITDPPTLIGFFLAGALVKPLWAALLIAVIWAGGMEMFVLSAAQNEQSNYAGEGFFLRAIVGVIVTSAVYLIVRRGRRRDEQWDRRRKAVVFAIAVVILTAVVLASFFGS